MRIHRLFCALLLLGLLACLLSACGPNPTADQQQFLADMAQGLTDRLSLQDREEALPRTPEEKADYRRRLVRCELDLLEKYGGLHFEDPAFDELAHQYIEACGQQLFAARQDRDEELGRLLWDAGYSARAAIIAKLCRDYALPLSEDRAAQYAPPEEEPLSDEPEREDYADCLAIHTLSGWTEHYSNGDYYHYDVLVTNQGAEEDLRVRLRAEFFDEEGRLTDSDEGLLFALGRDSTQYCRLRTDRPFARAEVRVESAEREEAYRCAAPDLQAEVNVPGEKIVAALTNTGTQTVSYGTLYCVFYKEGRVTDVQSGSFASTADPLRPGETQYTEIRLRRDRASYDRFEIYCRALGT